MFLKGVILLLTALFLGAFFWVALHRMNYPYELEWREDIIFESINRVLSGELVYCPPSIQWIAPPVSPLYIYLCALIEKIFGQSVFLPRLLSLIAFTCSSFLLYRFLRKTGVEDVFALGAIGLYLGFFYLTGSRYDLAHPYSLAIFFALAALSAAVMNENSKNAVLSGIYAILAFFTRTEFILLWILLALNYHIFCRRLTKYYLIPSGIVFLSGIIILHFSSAGWYWIYVYFPFISGKINFQALWSFWWKDLFVRLPILSVLSWVGFYGLIRLFIRRRHRHSDRIMAVMVIGFFALSFFSRFFALEETALHIPVFLALTGLSAWSLQHFHVNEYELGWLLPAGAKILVIIQMMVLFYLPNQLIPTELDREKGDRFIAKISDYPDNIYVPYHPYYQRLAGKSAFAEGNLLRRYNESAVSSAFYQVSADIDGLIEQRFFSAVILDEPRLSPPLLLQEKYRLVETIFQRRDSFYQRTGYKTRPQFIYQPR